MLQGGVRLGGAEPVIRKALPGGVGKMVGEGGQSDNFVYYRLLGILEVKLTDIRVVNLGSIVCGWASKRIAASVLRVYAVWTSPEIIFKPRHAHG